LVFSRGFPKKFLPPSPRPIWPWGGGRKGGGAILPLLASPELRNSYEDRIKNTLLLKANVLVREE